MDHHIENVYSACASNQHAASAHIEGDPEGLSRVFQWKLRHTEQLEDGHGKHQLQSSKDVAHNRYCFYTIVVVLGSHALDVGPNVEETAGYG
eukprot:Skav234121  [mRNA]  locus=scaffold753:18320:20848:+ [translate_table: standard]